MARAWFDAWGDAWGDSWGAKAAVAAATVTQPTVTQPVDFVISPPYYMHLIQTYRKTVSRIDAVQQDEAELLEMMQIYATATKARRMRT